ncbi:MAG: DMT family transporter [Pseudomonadota bacterium]
MTDQAKGLLITLLGVFFVIPDALFGRIIDGDPASIAFWRNLLSGGMLLLVVLILQGPSIFRAAFAVGWPAIGYGLAIGASGSLFMFAVNMTSVANVVFIIASMPAFAAIFSWVLVGERPSKRMIITMLVVAVGLVIVAVGSHGDGVSHWSGDLIALLVTISFALALSLVRRVKGANLLPMAGLGYMAAGLVLLPFAAPVELITSQPLKVFLHGGVFIFCSLTLLALGPRYIAAPEVALLILLETILAPILVWFVLGEVPGIWTWVGGAIILAALFVSNLIALRRVRQAS